MLPQREISPGPVRLAGVDVVTRFWSKVDRRGPDECWPWLAGKVPDGYGQFWMNGKNRKAHRVAYELVIGPIPDDVTLDHVRARGCIRRDCVNPRHLEPVTNAVNLLRGVGAPAVNARKTHCIRGHKFTTKSTRRWGPNGRWRECRICRTERDAERYSRRGREGSD